MPAATKKHFDVAKPGLSPADPSARPVIVSNRPLLKDPTIIYKEDDEINPEAVEKPKTLTKSTIKIQPPVNFDEEEITTNQAERPSEDDVSQSEENSDSESDPPKNKINSSSNPTAEAIVADKADKTAKINQLIDEGAYHLPINHHSVDRPFQLMIIILLALAISVVILNILLDIGLFGPNLNPLVNFIN